MFQPLKWRTMIDCGIPWKERGFRPSFLVGIAARVTKDLSFSDFYYSIYSKLYIISSFCGNGMK
jgi:hypothetical protein